MEWIKSQLWEIKKSSAVRLFGAVLAITHILTWVYWESQGALPLTYYAQSTPMCWSLFESCSAMRFLPTSLMSFLYNSYLALGIITAALFAATRLVGFGWFLLVLLFVTKLIFYFQDFRLSSNEHYYLFLLNFFFLFIPNKERTLKALVISFYIASGLLMLSPEWLTGQWFIEYADIHPKLAEWFAGLSFLIYLIAPMGLLFNSFKYFTIGFLTLVGYHSVMWALDGFFTPTVMLAGISLFLFSYFERKKLETEYIYQSFIRPEPSKLWFILGLAFFWGAQSIPYWKVNHPAATQVGDMLALNRTASSQECLQTTFLIYDNKTIEVGHSTPGERQSHMQCNAYLRFLDVKSLCGEHKKEPGFKTIASHLAIRDLRDQEFKSVFEISDFCSKDLNFRDLGLYSWNMDLGE